jgi:ubiquinone/menaquinone biosynthesis C-methylase UbiE/ribosomal protein S17E
MTNFEQQYYEDDSFWNDSLNDPANRLRIKKTIDLIPSDVHALVDLGCGNGVFLNTLISQKPQLDLLGIERSEAALRYVRTKKMQESIEKVSLPDRSFDCVSCLEVIEHLPVGIYDKALKEMTRISSKYVIVSVPYKENLRESFNTCPSCESSFSYEFHLRSFDDDQMEKLLVPFGFRCMSKDLLGLQESFVGHNLYKNIIYPEHKRKFVSPICPICGYENPIRKTSETGKQLNEQSSPHKSKSLKQTITSFITKAPKLLWPKEKKHYWILCLYERI